MLKNFFLGVILLLLVFSVGCSDVADSVSSAPNDKNSQISNLNGNNSDDDKLELSSYTRTNDSRVVLQLSEQATAKNIKLEIINNSDILMSYGTPYTLEKKIDDNWYILNKHQYFNKLGIMLGCYDTNEENIKFENELEGGYYRIIKTFNAGSEKIKCDVEFEIKGE